MRRDPERTATGFPVPALPTRSRTAPSHKRSARIEQSPRRDVGQTAASRRDSTRGAAMLIAVALQPTARTRSSVQSLLIFDCSVRQRAQQGRAEPGLLPHNRIATRIPSTGFVLVAHTNPPSPLRHANTDSCRSTCRIPELCGVRAALAKRKPGVVTQIPRHCRAGLRINASGKTFDASAADFVRPVGAWSRGASFLTPGGSSVRGPAIIFDVRLEVTTDCCACAS